MKSFILDDVVVVDNCSMCETDVAVTSTEEGYGIEIETVTVHTDGELRSGYL